MSLDPPWKGLSTMTVEQAHAKFGDLAQIRNGVTTWIEVEEGELVWRPVFDGVFHLVGYQAHIR